MHWAMTERENGGDAFYGQAIKEQISRKLIRNLQHLSIAQKPS